MDEVEWLRKENQRLLAENARLKGLLHAHGISCSNPPAAVGSVPKEHAAGEQERRIRLFMKLFCGRKDIYAKRWESKDGRKGYSPVCGNLWKPVCPKKARKPVKCSECGAHAWEPFTERVAYNHLVGRDERGTPFVAGTYALLEDSGCNFLVFDFDDHDGASVAWQEEARLLREVCCLHGIDTALERSRSGNGAHVWIFFAQSVPARLARRFGALLLSKGAETCHLKDFNTFDRMLPNQDELPAGGMGNLIALPLQGIPRKEGNSVFVDDNWNVVPDQWEYLAERQLLERHAIDAKIREWEAAEGNFIEEDESNADEEDSVKPWEREQHTPLEKADVTEPLHLTLADCLYIPKREVKPRTLNRIRKIATFSNQQFYKMQAMHYSTKQIPRRIQCFRDIDDYVALPRGCLDELGNRLREAGIAFALADERTEGRRIHVSFQGKLQPEQERAASAMLSQETGILGAATGFGKTVLGAYLIASRKVNTLILVHNREIMRGWQEAISKFLHIDEEMPVETGKRKRKAGIVGTIYSGHDSLHGIVDVAMASSLGRGDDIDERVREYGMVIMDECHHAGAYTFENVLWHVKARYVYGLTATPMREDGHEKIVFMQLGPVRYRLSEKDRASMQGFRHEIVPHFTGFAPATATKPSINDLYKLLISDKRRNQMLVDDIIACMEDGRTPLVLTKFKEHAKMLCDAIAARGMRAILLLGGASSKELSARQAELAEASEESHLALVATGKYIGEGFNFPRLDTLFLTVPISWKGNIAQYAGRLHRDYDGKETVIIHDYVDVHVGMLERMYRKRLLAYAAMGYTVFAPAGTSGNVIYTVRDYRERFQQDFHAATDRICISSPRLSRARVRQFVQAVRQGEHSTRTCIVWTLPDNAYADKQQGAIRAMKQSMREAGIDVREREGLNCHFAVLDDALVWYGSMNFLLREHEDDILMRIHSEAVAKELMGVGDGEIRLL